MKHIQSDRMYLWIKDFLTKNGHQMPLKNGFSMACTTSGKILSTWLLKSMNERHNLLENNHCLNFRANEFTQMMWGNAKFIGCAAARVGDGYFFTCYYYPKGNIIGSPVFTFGDPCSKCPSSR